MFVGRWKEENNYMARNRQCKVKIAFSRAEKRGKPGATRITCFLSNARLIRATRWG